MCIVATVCLIGADTNLNNAGVCLLVCARSEASNISGLGTKHILAVCADDVFRRLFGGYPHGREGE